nr:unnamed protein product [Callosobruchus chinensis]
MSEVTGISQTSIQRILKHYKWHPYKIQLLHELNEDDHDRRLQFCEIMKCGEAAETSKHVIFDCPALCRRRSSYLEVVQEEGRQVPLFALFALATASPSGGHVLQGPSSKTTLVGPEGSVISAHQPGGTVVHDEHPGYAAHGHDHAAPVAYAAPVAHYAHHVPIVAVPHHAYAAPHHAAYVAPHHGHAATVVSGPSGHIVAGHAAHGYAAHAPLVAAHVIAPYHEHEGQYVHDYTETLYDDGSYKPHYYH